MMMMITVNLCNRTGEDGKPCVTTMTTILFEITFAKLPFPLNRSLCKDQKTLMLSEDHDIKCKLWPCHVCHAQAFCRPLLPAVLLRKLINDDDDDDGDDDNDGDDDDDDDDDDPPNPQTFVHATRVYVSYSFRTLIYVLYSPQESHQ